MSGAGGLYFSLLSSSSFFFFFPTLFLLVYGFLSRSSSLFLQDKYEMIHEECVAADCNRRLRCFAALISHEENELWIMRLATECLSH